MAVLSNGSGAAVMAGTVTPSTFAGWPLVAHGTSMGGARWAAVQALAVSFQNPRTGAVPPCLGTSSAADLALVRSALLGLRPYLDSAVQTPPSVPTATSPQIRAYPPLCGPLLIIPNGSGDSDRRDELWDWAATTARTTGQGSGCWGCGLRAVSSATPWLSPPIYVLGWSTYLAQLQSLRTVWQAPPPPTQANFDALAAVEVARPGVSRSISPVLVSLILLARP